MLYSWLVLLLVIFADNRTCELVDYDYYGDSTEMMDSAFPTGTIWEIPGSDVIVSTKFGKLLGKRKQEDVDVGEYRLIFYS